MLIRTLKSNPTKDTFKNVNARPVDHPGRLTALAVFP
jgi:hypothetical protein